MIAYTHFLIKPVDEFKDTVNKYYAEHGTFHNDDSGLDVFCLEDLTVPAHTTSFKIPLHICVKAVNLPQQTPTGFYLYPRSSTGSKTPLRLCNSVGIIDAGYRGQLMAIVDNISDQPFSIKKGERYFQLCGPTLAPIKMCLVEKLDATLRGEGGFGSTKGHAERTC